ncbi:hypothetical protein [Bifidobacterium biavatii]|uniref:Uncharacterized protein n=1 Tax=Bifidobacterium biavatii DSM 23969 TaxID=1437608 RepID=A0A087A4Q3_9BIFI|nr:hypothetical protein [Bifidobacterium biavatii]KFI53753.1 hypothetical protein BBIA_1349 [Bifidobacterium biavatii DSM 23969]
MGRTVFTAEEVRYLGSLPVVANATTARITYTRAFKRDCLRRYLDGEKPVDLFREAGLKPEIIGRKRIERCLARWKAERDVILNDSTGDATISADAVSALSGTTSAATRPFASSVSASFASSTAPDRLTVSSAESYAAPDVSAASPAATASATSYISGNGLVGTDDVRDRIIVQQTHYIDALEREIADLRRRLQE